MSTAETLGRSYHEHSAKEILVDLLAMPPNERVKASQLLDANNMEEAVLAAGCPIDDINMLMFQIGLDQGAPVVSPEAMTLHSSRSVLACAVNDHPTDDANQHHPNLISLENVNPEAIEWVWDGYIPKGKITDVIGDGDLGKSLVLTDIIARMSRGKPMPDNPDGPRRDPINIIMMVGEDDVADTVVPRLIAAGADLSMIKVLAGPNVGSEKPIVFPDDVPAVAGAIADTNAGVLVIDPVMGFLSGKVKSGIDSEVRTALMSPLRQIAERHGCAVLSLRHTNKSEGASASMRGGGSVAFRNAARAGLAFGPDHDDVGGERRIMVQSKKNLGRWRPALAYRIESTFGRVEVEGAEGTPVVVWDGVVEGATAETVLGPLPKPSGPREGTKTEAATNWLCNRLADGMAVAATVIRKEMMDAGFSEKVIESAKKYAHVVSERQSNGATGEGAWFWLLK